MVQSAKHLLILGILASASVQTLAKCLAGGATDAYSEGARVSARVLVGMHTLRTVVNVMAAAHGTAATPTAPLVRSYLPQFFKALHCQQST